MEEFSGIRARLYKECLRDFPDARVEDIEVMKKYLNPKNHEVVLEVGAGSGFFSGILAESVKKLVVTDPSDEQLEEVKELGLENIELIQAGAGTLTLKKESIDAIWSFGAMHHCFNKVQAFKNFEKVLKNNGRLIIADVWHNSKLARHFDDKVAKYCATGHEVAFWTDEFAQSLCFVNGFENPEIYNLNIKWRFKKKEDIGIFLYKIHAMTKTTEEECLKGAEELLGIEKKGDIYHLNWPMKIMITRKK